MNKDAFFQYEENRALSGYRSAWLVKLSGETKYHLIGLTESVPYVFGDKETFEFDILQSQTKGQVEGKMSLEPQDIEVLHHRDNAYRFEKLRGQTLDFMTINAEFVGYKFTGTVDYRPNNAEADVNRATVTITPISASVTPVLNAREEVIETLCFANVISETVKSGTFIDCSVKQSLETLDFVVSKIDKDNKEKILTATEEYNRDGNKIKISTVGLYAITVKQNVGEDGELKYASWTTTVYVEE